MAAATNLVPPKVCSLWSKLCSTAGCINRQSINYRERMRLEQSGREIGLSNEYLADNRDILGAWWWYTVVTYFKKIIRIIDALLHTYINEHWYDTLSVKSKENGALVNCHSMRSQNCQVLLLMPIMWQAHLWLYGLCIFVLEARVFITLNTIGQWKSTVDLTLIVIT
jgi:hypothetical protein